MRRASSEGKHQQTRLSSSGEYEGEHCRGDLASAEEGSPSSGNPQSRQSRSWRTDPCRRARSHCTTDFNHQFWDAKSSKIRIYRLEISDEFILVYVPVLVDVYTLYTPG